MTTNLTALDITSSSRSRRSVQLFICFLALSGAMTAQQAPATTAATETPPKTGDQTPTAEEVQYSTLPNGEKVTKMNPFEVQDSDRGYYGANTMSGTRINSKVADMASSITVITKEQMADFALLDINDVFSYEASTEGSGNYTDFSVNASSQPQDNLMTSPTTANRIRGLGSANIAYGNFGLSGRMPIDPSVIDGLEISRGPNSTIFGLGNASGTVNQIPSSANLSANKATVETRWDSFDGYRESLDINRVLLNGKLAVRASEVIQRTGYERKPSGTDSKRYNFMVKYQPFSKTTISASYLTYKNTGNRPNSITPRDAISNWVAAGSPGWNPVTNQTVINGVATAGIAKFNGVADFNSAFQTSGRGQSLMYIDPTGITYWTAPRGTSTTNPIGPLTDQAGFNLVTLNPSTLRATQPLWQTDAPVVSKSEYDWSSINALAQNYFDEEDQIGMVSVDQIFFSTEHQMLAAEAGWLREYSPTYHQDLQAGGGSGSTYLYIDPNIKRLDGSPNPYYLRPYFGATEGTVYDTPLQNDTYRAQVAYKLDFTPNPGWTKWLGMHQISAYGEYRDYVKRQYVSEYAMLDNHSYLAAGAPRANAAALAGDTLPQDQAAAFGTRSFNYFYVGDANGNNVDYAPGRISPGNYPFTWGNFAAGQSTNEQTQLGLANTINGTAGTANTLQIQKTQGIVLQSHLLMDRVVLTGGLRKDRVYDKNGVNAQLMPNGITPNFAWDKQWASGDYQTNQGITRTVGAVVRVFPWFSVFADKSDSFVPAPPAVDLHGNFLPNPEGKNEDWGFAFDLFQGKLQIRVNEYLTKQINTRDGTSTTLATRAVKMDIYDGNASRDFALDLRIPAQIGLPPALVSNLENIVNFNPGYLAEADNAVSDGREVEINYNPTPFWTMKFNGTQRETIQSSIAPDLTQYLAERMPIWTTLVDPTLKTPWYTTSYDGGTVQTPSAYLLKNVTTPLNIALAKQGKALPETPKYGANFLTNLQFAQFTQRPIWRDFNVGGAVRWVQRAAIGYYGVQQLPAIITDLDPNHPIYGQSQTNFDVFTGYRTRIIGGKVGLTVQLNVRNVQAGHARLQAISAYPDGTPNVLRIIDPRQFILSATFSM